MTDLERAIRAAEKKQLKAWEKALFAEQADAAANNKLSRALLVFLGITVIWSVTRDNRAAEPYEEVYFGRWAEVTPTDRVLVEDDE